MSGIRLNGKRPEKGKEPELNYRVGRRGSSLDKISINARYILMENILERVTYFFNRRLKYELALKEQDAGASRLSIDNSMAIDEMIERLKDAKDFDAVAYIEGEIKNRIETVDLNHAEIEVLLKVRDMIDAIENPPKSGDQSSAKKGS